MPLAFDWNAVVAGAVSAAVTGTLAIFVAREQRKKTPAEASDQIASAFSKLVNELQEESTKHLEQIKTLREEGHRLRNAVMRLRYFAEAVFKHIGVLERCIADMGGECPARPDLPPLDGDKAA